MLQTIPQVSACLINVSNTLHLSSPTTDDQSQIEIMTDSVNETEALQDSAAFPTFTLSSNQKGRWLQPILNIAFALLHRIETLFFYAGIHPSYIFFRLRMAFQLLASRFGPFPVQGLNKGQGDFGTSDSPSEEESDGIAMTSKTRTIHMKRRRAEVSERVSTEVRAYFAQLDLGSSYPGMVNLSGTLCYMNSILQSFASLTYLQKHLDSVIELAEEVDLNTPVTDALSVTLEQLNTPSPSSKPHPLRPYALVEALSTLPSVRRLLQTREHQDAHELFLLLTNAISDELAKLDAERRKDKGLGEVLDFHKSVMQQLANAKQGIVNEQNQMGRWKGKEKTRIFEAERLGKSKDEGAKSSTARKKRAANARKLANRLSSLLETGDIANMEQMESLQDCKWLKATSKSARQSMIARPPQILALHLSRSGFTPYGELYKKTANVSFPLLLDITDFTTSGALHTKADGSISHHADKEWQEASPPSEDTAPPRSLYRLDAVICHYGYTSSFGHFVAYRRKPDTILGPTLAHKSCSDYCECENCQLMGQVRDSSRLPLKNWLRISDADVEEVSEAEVLAEKMSAFLLFYEKVGDKIDETSLKVELSEPPVMNKGTIAEALSNLNENSGMRYRSNHIESRDAKL
ncbi:hypothetical protein QFC22_000746 [Naganishia vaughanmartiniae]|uniref:Uncharacterized protein n=1 Tax=Naganishia vaughanmartiniae TaxID=1424756 RepID=A0ACC2XIU6_9TREE|nr:hypothetical protein QFC22_000746 [Naganishia vaughanmartiniae]